MNAVRRMALLSIATSVGTIVLKFGAYFLTGSVSLWSDALESLVNLAAGLVAMGALTLAAQPADDRHAYGHDKAEYFSSGVEGTLILVAAASIVWSALHRFAEPQALEHLGPGILVALLAGAMNFATSRVMLRVGRQHDSITIEADAHHLMTDVWTSVGVVVGVGAVGLTHWQWLDPVVALVVAANIVWTGVQIVRKSVFGLMDTPIDPGEQEALRRVMEPYVSEGIQYHALRTRQSGARRFVSLHVLVPGAWSVRQGHGLLERLEADIRRVIPSVSVLTHLEAIEDPASFEDVRLDRPDPPAQSEAPAAR
jgi:cation diffusion facilitator family transporter